MNVQKCQSLSRQGSVLVLFLLLFGVGIGCGESKQEKQNSNTESNSKGEANSNANSNGNNSSNASSEEKTGFWKNDNGQQMYGQVPVDIYFGSPLQVAANATPAGTATSPLNGTTTPAVTPTGSGTSTTQAGTSTNTEAAPSSAANGKQDWKDLISANVLDDEMKYLTNTLKKHLQSVSSYNSAYKEIRALGSSIAAMANIAGQHPGDIRWKDKAKYLREFGLKVTEAAEGPGKKFLDATSLPFESIEAILSGSLPADVDESAKETVPFDYVADLSGVMKRMQVGFDWLKSEVNNEERFKEFEERIRREGEVMRAFGKVIADPSYPSTDEAPYLKVAQGVVDDSEAILKSLDAGNLQGFNEAMGKLQKRCADCHNEYRFAE